MSERLAKRVLLIGWDAADWKLIDPLMEAGLMPTLKGMIEQGVMGNISTMRPILSPMLWNSIATGKRPDKHGIHGFMEPRPDGSGVQTVSSTSRTCKALWNILTQKGFKSNVLGWYASHPAEPIDGVCVSEHFFSFIKSAETSNTPPPVPPQSVHPTRLVERLAELRLGAKDIGPYHLVPFCPKVGEIPADEATPLSVMQRMLAKTGSLHAAATEIMEHEPWDFTAIYYDAIDHFGHGFMKYHPPRMEEVTEQRFEWFKDVMNGIYRFHDMMLERLLQLAGDDCTVIIVSDHGFHSDHLRPRSAPGLPSLGPEAWHRPHGIFVMKGPHVRKDERVYGASILDVTPTVLTLFGLPVAEDMDGKVLVQCFDKPVAIERIESWEKVEGFAGTHPPDLQVDPFEQQQAMEQLAELGYIDLPADGTSAAFIKRAKRESKYNLAMVHTDANQYGKAVKLLEELHAEEPYDLRYTTAVAQCYLMMRRLPEARKLLESDRAAGPLAAQQDLLIGVLEFLEGNREKALELLLRAEQIEPRLPTLHLQIGNVYVRMRKWEEAKRAFEKALAIDAVSPQGYYGLGVVAFHQERYEDSVEHCLRAVGLMHYFPRAHLTLGMGLARLGWYERCIAALAVALSQDPSTPFAHRLTAVCYGHLGKPELALAHRRYAQQQIDAANARRAANPE